MDFNTRSFVADILDALKLILLGFYLSIFDLAEYLKITFNMMVQSLFLIKNFLVAFITGPITLAGNVYLILYYPLVLLAHLYLNGAYFSPIILLISFYYFKLLWNCAWIIYRGHKYRNSSSQLN